MQACRTTSNQSQVLVTLIRQVVGQPKDWLPQFDPITGQPINPLDMGNPGGMDMSVPGADNNNLGFYPPANAALVVKARPPAFTPAAASPLFSNNPGMGPAGNGELSTNGIPRGAALAKLDPNKDPRIKVAGNGDERPDPNKPAPDARKIWQDALEKGVENPGLIVACADYLALCLKWDHAAEFLKANLRQGIVVKPWVYESLALALRESGGSPGGDRTRPKCLGRRPAAPLDATGFLQGVAGHGQPQALRTGRGLLQASGSTGAQPGSRPYAEGLLYAEQAQDSKGMEWAAGNLLPPGPGPTTTR